MDCGALMLETSRISHTLPNFPLFVRLLGFAHRFDPSRCAILDLQSGRQGSHSHLLTDLLSLRSTLYRQLDEPFKRRLHDDEGTAFFLLLAPPSYEYVIAFLAILAIGGIIVPISPQAPLQEAKYYAGKTPPAGILYHPSCARTSLDLQKHLTASSSHTAVPAINISRTLGQDPLPAGQIHISPYWSLNPQHPGLTIFTSGTTGSPKPVLLPREILSSGSQALADHFELTPDDVALHCMPVHHIAGITVCFVPFLLSGARIEFDAFHVQRIWQRWRQGGITVFGGVPTMYSRLMREYEDHVRNSPDSDVFVNGLRRLRFLMSGTSALPSPLRRKWSRLSGGKRILERYGTTEFSTVILTPLRNNDTVPDGSIGKVLSGCEVKLAGGHEGEILVKAPAMFLGYYNDAAASAASFDEDGFYKTGDIGRLEGDYWFISGRASVDIIKSGGYKISALDVERELAGLKYISEAAVVGVADDDFGQRVAAAVVLRGVGDLTLAHLRGDLRRSMSSYKLPTLLCVVKELPRTGSGKVQKALLRQEVFEATEGLYNIQALEKSSSKRVQARL